MNRLRSLDEAGAEPFAFAGPAHRVLAGRWDDPREAASQYLYEKGEAPAALYMVGRVGFVLVKRDRAPERDYYDLRATRLPFGSAALCTLNGSSDPRIARLLLDVAPIVYPGVKRPVLDLPAPYDEEEAPE